MLGWSLLSWREPRHHEHAGATVGRSLAIGNGSHLRGHPRHHRHLVELWKPRERRRCRAFSIKLRRRGHRIVKGLRTSSVRGRLEPRHLTHLRLHLLDLILVGEGADLPVGRRVQHLKFLSVSAIRQLLDVLLDRQSRRARSLLILLDQGSQLQHTTAITFKLAQLTFWFTESIWLCRTSMSLF